MNESVSRILRIGLINSGMFDLLELNMDVEAIHFIAQNNVGKTSLIELIQFFYFHEIREITFSKSIPESLAFYFRPEGSYILFEVRTILGTIRTVGIYGEGTANTREIFVFDGSFKFQDFLDGSSCVIPIKYAQEKLFDRRFCRYQKFERYEKALLGQDKDDQYNVQMFNLSSVSNLRLLRSLLKGLLRLDKLSSKDTQQFLIKIVESSTVKTTINIAHDFDRKNREIQNIQNQLNHLKQIEPIITRWQKLQSDIKLLSQQYNEKLEQLFHISCRYLEFLKEQKQQAQRDYNTIEQQISGVDSQVKRLVEERTNYQQQINQLKKIIGEFELLETFCASHLKIQAEQAREQFIHQKVEIQRILSTIHPEDLENLKKRLTRNERERDGIQGRIQNRTLEDLWTDKIVSEENQALLKFLISEKLLSIPVAEIVTDEDTVIDISRRAFTFIDQQGAFKGFGLKIPKSKWFIPKDNIESTEEQLERIKRNIDELREKVEVAEHREQKKQELNSLEENIRQQDDILNHFLQFERYEREYESVSLCRLKLGNAEGGYSRIEKSIQDTENELNSLRSQSLSRYQELSERTATSQRIEKDHNTLKVFDSLCPENISAISNDDLAETYQLTKNHVKGIENNLKPLNQESDELRADLELRYEMDFTDSSFEQWIEQKLDITKEIVRVETQLLTSYDQLIVQIGKELSNLKQAFESMKLKVSDLNHLIGKVSISNIESIKVVIKESELVEAIQQTTQMQEDLFSPIKRQNFSLEEAQKFVGEYLLEKLRKYGSEIDLKDMFQIEFSVQFSHTKKPTMITEINTFESNGTRTGIKIVLYLGLIKLLQEQRKSLGSRIPFFLDEVGSIDSNNLRQLITYCSENNFLPIFASPDIRQDIPYNYIFKRIGKRSILENIIILNDKEDLPSYETP